MNGNGNGLRGVDNSSARGVGFDPTSYSACSMSCSADPTLCLADKVFELSSYLGRLRSQSAAICDALLSLSQGVPELEQAFQPLLAALKAGLADCDEADLEAVFGRPIPPKGSLEALQACTNDPKNGLKNGADNDPGVGAGGTAAAVERLALSISLLDRDVKIAHTLKDHRACLRVIAKWARETTTVKGEINDRGLVNDGRMVADRYDRDGDWKIRIFRHSTGSRISNCLDRKKNSKGKKKDDVHLGEEAYTPASEADSVTRDKVAGGARVAMFGNDNTPVVVVKALEAPLPAAVRPLSSPLADAAVTKKYEDAGGISAVRKQATAAVAGGGSGSWSGWLNPLSWITGYGARRAEETPLPLPEQLPLFGSSSSPSFTSVSLEAPVPVPPRVFVRVVFAGRLADMARLAREVERDGEFFRRAYIAAAASVADAGVNDAGGLASMASSSGTEGNEGNEAAFIKTHSSAAAAAKYARETSAVVELIKSEVRVDFQTITRQEPEGPCADSTKSGPRLARSPPVKLQVVLQLQTRVSVVVAKLLHSGGEVLSAPMPSPFCSKYRGKVSKRSALTPTAPAYTMSISGDDGGGVVDAHAMGEEEAIGLAKGGAGGSFSSGLYYRQGGSANKTRSRDWVGDQAYDGGRSSKRTGGDTGDRSVCVNEDAGDDVIPSGWVEAPAELLRPTGPVKDGCELKVGTEHLLGVTVILPSHPLPAGPRNSRLQRRMELKKKQTPLKNRKVQGLRHTAELGKGHQQGVLAKRNAAVLQNSTLGEDEAHFSSGQTHTSSGHVGSTQNFNRQWGGRSSGKKRSRPNDDGAIKWDESERSNIVNGHNNRSTSVDDTRLLKGWSTGVGEKPGASQSHQNQAPAPVVLEASLSSLSGAVVNRAASDERGRCDASGDGGREVKRRRKTGWGWGFLSVFQRGHKELNAGPTSSPTSSIIDSSSQNHQQEQPKSNRESDDEGRDNQQQGGREEEVKERNRPLLGNRVGSDNEPRPASLRRSPLVITVVLSPPELAASCL